MHPSIISGVSHYFFLYPDTEANLNKLEQSQLSQLVKRLYRCMFVKDAQDDSVHTMALSL